METYIANKKEMREMIESAVDKAIQKNLPSAIQKATRKKWLKSSEVMEILQCSRPHLQYLRDSKQISFHQHNRSVLFDIDEVQEFFKRGKVKSLKAKE